MAVPERRVVEEIPDSMKQLVSFIAKAFYGPEYAVIVEYIKRNVCIREERLRDLTKIDSKQLRQILCTLRNDKLLKERQVQDTRPNGMKGRSNYYFVDYRAALNVTKYKLDHMRQKLELQERDTTHRASYKCSRCQKTYEVIEMDRLIDLATGEMSCINCGGLVEEDALAGPSDSTRSSLQRFNEQLAALFSILQHLDGVQLAAHLLEPSLAIEKEIELHEKKVKEQQSDSNPNPTAEEAPSKTGGGGVDYNLYNEGQGLTVNIGGSAGVEPETAVKQLPQWLSDEAHMLRSQSAAVLSALDVPNSELPSSSGGAVFQKHVVEAAHGDKRDVEQQQGEHPTTLISPSAGFSSPQRTSDDFVANLLRHEVDMKSPTRSDASQGDFAGGGKQTESEEEDEFEDVADVAVSVAGAAYTLQDVMSEPQLVSRMSEEERNRYIELYQRHMAHVHEDD